MTAEHTRPGNRTGTGHEFMERTKYRFTSRSDQQKGLPQPPLEIPPDSHKPMISLAPPNALAIPSLDLRAAIEDRRSTRSYLREPITLDELSFLLWCTQGVQQVHGEQVAFRTVPSAGARHAFETYVLANNIEGLEPGMYRFLARSHWLQQVERGPAVAQRVTRACFDQQFILHCGAAFIWTAVPYRMTWRYGERGFRYLHLDAGHVCQNLYLAAEAVGCGTCAIAAFDDDEMGAVLGIHGPDQFVIYLATVGKKDTPARQKRG